MEPSAVTTLLSANNSTNSPRESLALEILHNLQHQHRWTDLKMFSVSPAPSNNTTQTSPEQNFLISGLPPKHSYVHPDLQKWLIRNHVNEEDVTVQREWVLPLSIGEKWSLRQFCWMFEGLPARDGVKYGDQEVWKDAKRVMLGMIAHNGMGGDGTVAYYIMQEGDVKPRQNG